MKLVYDRVQREQEGTRIILLLMLASVLSFFSFTYFASRLVSRSPNAFGLCDHFRWRAAAIRSEPKHKKSVFFAFCFFSGAIFFSPFYCTPFRSDGHSGKKRNIYELLQIEFEQSKRAQRSQ